MRGLRRFLAAAILIAATGTAAAQGAPKGPEPDAAAPPFAIGPGWRYDKRPSDVHMFICEQDSCNRSSRVSYRLYARDDSITLERFRREQASVVKALEQRAPPGT